MKAKFQITSVTDLNEKQLSIQFNILNPDDSIRETTSCVVSKGIGEKPMLTAVKQATLYRLKIATPDNYINAYIGEIVEFEVN